MGARGKEHAEVLRLFRRHPHAEAEHVHLGEGRQFAGEAQQHVAAGDQGGGAGSGVGQHALVIGQLQIEQRLVQALAARPAEHGDGHEQLARRRVGRQAPAQAAGVQDEFAALTEPGGEGLAGGGRAPGFGQEVGRAAARAQRLARGVGGGEPFGPPPAGQRLELRPPCAAGG